MLEDHASLMFRRSFEYMILVTVLVLLGYCSAARNATVEPTKPVAKNCALVNGTCRNCTAFSNCIWCFSQSFCADHKWLDIRGHCEEDDWYRGDCDKPKKEEVLLYVLLACALFLLLVVILLVLYIFLCKVPRNKSYSPLDTKDEKKRRKRTPLMSKKFKPVGSRTDELKKKYGLQ